MSKGQTAFWGISLWLGILLLTACLSTPRPPPPTPLPPPTDLSDSISLPDLPKTYPTWRRYVDSQYGFSIPYPSDWQMTTPSQTTALAEIKLVPTARTDAAVSVQVVKLEALKTLSEVGAPPFQSIPGFGLLQQGKRFGSQLQTQKLTGET